MCCCGRVSRLQHVVSGTDGSQRTVQGYGGLGPAVAVFMIGLRSMQRELPQTASDVSKGLQASAARRCHHKGSQMLASVQAQVSSAVAFNLVTGDDHVLQIALLLDACSCVGANPRCLAAVSAGET